MTLWALFFLMSVSLFISLVGVGLTARRETTRQLEQDFQASTRTIVKQTSQHVKKRHSFRRSKPLKQDSPQRLLE